MNNLIAEYLKRENVNVFESAPNWRSAIMLCTDSLVKHGYVTENYPKRIIEITETYGAYYLIAKDLALLHARPEDGVIKQQLALSVIKQPVVFDNKEDNPVRLFITLCAKDSVSHLEMLQKLAELMMDESRIEKCASITDPEELYQEVVNL